MAQSFLLGTLLHETPAKREIVSGLDTKAVATAVEFCLSQEQLGCRKDGCLVEKFSKSLVVALSLYFFSFLKLVSGHNTCKRIVVRDASYVYLNHRTCSTKVTKHLGKGCFDASLWEVAAKEQSSGRGGPWITSDQRRLEAYAFVEVREHHRARSAMGAAEFCSFYPQNVWRPMGNLRTPAAMVCDAFSAFPEHLGRCLADCLLFAGAAKCRAQDGYLVAVEQRLCRYLLLQTLDGNKVKGRALSEMAAAERAPPADARRASPSGERPMHFAWVHSVASRPRDVPPGVFLSQRVSRLSLPRRVGLERRLRLLFSFTLFHGSEPLPYLLAEALLWMAPVQEWTGQVVQLDAERRSVLETASLLSGDSGGREVFVAAERRVEAVDEAFRTARKRLRQGLRYLHASSRSDSALVLRPDFEAGGVLPAEFRARVLFLPAPAPVQPDGTPAVRAEARVLAAVLGARSESLFFSNYYNLAFREGVAASSPPSEELGKPLPLPGHGMVRSMSGLGQPFLQEDPEGRSRGESSPGPREFRKLFRDRLEGKPRLPPQAAPVQGQEGVLSVGRELQAYVCHFLARGNARGAISPSSFCAPCLGLAEALSAKLAGFYAAGALNWVQTVSLCDMLLLDLQGFVGAFLWTAGPSRSPDGPQGRACAGCCIRGGGAEVPFLGFATSRLAEAFRIRLASSHAGGVLANSTGSGKTRVMILFALTVPLVHARKLQMLADLGQVEPPVHPSPPRASLVVVPNMLVGHWAEEISKTCRLTGLLGGGTNPALAGPSSLAHGYALCLATSREVRDWSAVLEGMHLAHVAGPAVVVVSSNVVKLHSLNLDLLASKGNFASFLVDEVHDIHGKKKACQALAEGIRRARMFGAPVSAWGCTATPYHSLPQTAQLLGFAEAGMMARISLAGGGEAPCMSLPEFPVPQWSLLLQKALDLSAASGDFGFLGELFLLSRSAYQHSSQAPIREGEAKLQGLVPPSAKRPKVGVAGGRLSRKPSVELETVLVEETNAETVSFLRRVNHMVGEALLKLTSSSQDAAKRRRLFSLMERISSDGRVNQKVFLRVLDNLCTLSREEATEQFWSYFAEVPAPEGEGPSVFYERGDCCCVCLEQHQRPVCLRGCGHVFCKDCILGVAEVVVFPNSRAVQRQKRAVQRAASGREMSCPWCRQKSDFPVGVLPEKTFRQRAGIRQEQTPAAANGSSAPPASFCSSRSYFEEAGFTSQEVPGRGAPDHTAREGEVFVRLEAKLLEFRRRIRLWAMQAAADWEQGQADLRSKRKLLVYFKYPSFGTSLLVETQDALRRAFGPANPSGPTGPMVLSAGTSSLSHRLSVANVGRFMRGEGIVLLLHIERYNSGLNFSDVSDLWLMGHHRVLSKNDQCLGRCQRLGQTFDTVKISRFVSSNSFEEFLHALAQTKERVSASVGNSLLLSHHLLKDKEGTRFHQFASILRCCAFLQQIPALLAKRGGRTLPGGIYCADCGKFLPSLIIDAHTRLPLETRENSPGPDPSDIPRTDVCSVSATHSRTLSHSFALLPPNFKETCKVALRVWLDVKKGTLQRDKFQVRESAAFLSELFRTSCAETLFFEVFIPLALQVTKDGARELPSVVCSGTCPSSKETHPALLATFLQSVSRHHDYNLLRPTVNWRSARLRTTSAHRKSQECRPSAEQLRLMQAMVAGSSNSSNFRTRRVREMTKWDMVLAFFS